MLLQPDQPAPEPGRERGKRALLVTGAVLAVVALSLWLNNGKGANRHASASAPSAAACSAIESGWSSFESASKPAEQSQSWDAMFNAETAYAKIAQASSSNPLVIKMGADLVLLGTDIVGVEGADDGLFPGSAGSDASEVDAASAQVAADEQAIASACG